MNVAEGEAFGRRRGRDLFEVADAPLWIARPQLSVKRRIALGGMSTLSPKWAVEKKQPARPQYFARTAQQGFCRGPGSDVDHIEADRGVHMSRGPDIIVNVEEHRRPHIGKGLSLTPGCDGAQALCVALGRLPDEPL